MALACLGVEMPNLCCALTATKLGSGECRPASTPPLLDTHFASNPTTRATLHHYHLQGDKVNAHSATE